MKLNYLLKIVKCIKFKSSFKMIGWKRPLKLKQAYHNRYLIHKVTVIKKQKKINSINYKEEYFTS